MSKRVASTVDPLTDAELNAIETRAAVREIDGKPFGVSPLELGLRYRKDVTDLLAEIRRQRARLNEVDAATKRIDASLDRIIDGQTPKLLTPSALKRRLATYNYVAQMIVDGLRGKPFDWGNGARRAWTPFAADMGMTLVTKTSMTRLGYQLKRDAKPVGHAYFGAPIKVTAALYVLECQCKAVKK